MGPSVLTINWILKVVARVYSSTLYGCWVVLESKRVDFALVSARLVVFLLPIVTALVGTALLVRTLFWFSRSYFAAEDVNIYLHEHSSNGMLFTGWLLPDLFVQLFGSTLRSSVSKIYFANIAPHLLCTVRV